MTPETFLDGKVQLYCGDCLTVMDVLEPESVDAVLTDPPYHLTSIVKRFGAENAAPAKEGTDGLFARSSRGFMGKQWDGGDIAFRPETWARALRVLKPGGHLLAFSASRNVGLMQVAIEAAGFETRDCILDLIESDTHIENFIGSLSDEQRAQFFRCVEESNAGGLMAWLFGTGFPKSHNIALDYEKRLCEEIERGGRKVWVYRDTGEDMARSAPFRHPLARQWAGWGSALKPAFEPIVMARKPLAEGLSIADNVERYGTGAINIDATRIGAPIEYRAGGLHRGSGSTVGSFTGSTSSEREAAGRWPANITHDGSAEVQSLFPDSVSTGGQASLGAFRSGAIYGNGVDSREQRDPGFGDAGSAARFYYSAKADADDRLGSSHPTIKRVDLIQYLVRLITAPGQTVLDCFAGTGTTGEAAFREGRRAILIEREAEYQEDIRRRMRLCLAGPEERARETIKQKTKDAAIDAGPLFGGL
jgi:site-specific DNA-methyltransferase (adenine-specific)